MEVVEHQKISACLWDLRDQPPAIHSPVILDEIDHPLKIKSPNKTFLRRALRSSLLRRRRRLEGDPDRRMEDQAEKKKREAKEMVLNSLMSKVNF